MPKFLTKLIRPFTYQNKGNDEYPLSGNGTCFLIYFEDNSEFYLVTAKHCFKAGKELIEMWNTQDFRKLPPLR